MAVAIVLIVNLIPVLGVVALGWNPAQILILYWVENVILGVLTLPRIIAAGRARFSAIFMAGFFVTHYGVFCVGHLVFAMSLIADFARAGPGQDAGIAATLGQPGLVWVIASIAVLNLAGQVRDWWMPGRWRDAEPMSEMFKPYGRIVVLHLTVLLGAWVMLTLNAPAATILLLCGLKALLELALLGVGVVFGGPRTAS